MIIKILLLAGIALVVLFALRGSGTTNLAVRRLGGLLFALVAAVSILVPELVSGVAELVGVGRGTDLVLYGLVVAFLFVSAALYQRVHQLETRLAQLTRSLAIATADKDADQHQESA